ncbi:unnamed protein product, partial [Laminaria digitata]
MNRARITPDVSSITAAITACSRGSDLPAALDLFEALRSGKRGPRGGPGGPRSDQGGPRSGQGAPRVDVVAYGAAAAACARGLDEERALLLLREMEEDGLKPGAPMFGAVIDAYARRGRWEQALELI